MEKIQMTQININNYMLYTKSDAIKLCKICQTYPNSNLVDIICIEDKKRIDDVDCFTSLKPIEASKDIIDTLNFSINKRLNEPMIFGHPANEVFDLVYKNIIRVMVVLILDCYYLLLNDTQTLSKSDFPLCVHHLQNMITSVGGDSVENEISLISLLNDKVLKESRF